MKVKHRAKSLLNRRVSLSELISQAIRCVSTYILPQFIFTENLLVQKNLSSDLYNTKTN